jgi:fumarylpyruvate hydrolase
MRYILDPPDISSLPIVGSEKLFPVRRIYCVGRNYAEHTLEMGGDPTRESPFFFSKPADTLVTGGQDIPYPSKTKDLHHEVELVVAISAAADHVSVEDAADCIFGYAVGNDLTRRDLQAEAKKTGRPWETGKGFDFSAPISELVPIEQCGAISEGEISLKVNGEYRQRGDLKQMIWSVEEIIAELSTLFTLKPGDLIFTGTPAGVGSLKVGDVVECYAEGVASVTNRII